MDVSSPLGPIFAFWAGLISILSPCVLPLVPVYLSHLTGQISSVQGNVATAGGISFRNNLAFLHAVAFVLGFSIVFTALGASVGVVGYALQNHQVLLGRLAGTMVIVMGLHIAGIIKIPFLERTYQVDVNTSGAPGFSRSFVIGSAFAVGWMPCIGPILGGILGLAATSTTAWQGSLLLLCYCAGLSVPFLLAGAALGTATRAIRVISRYMPVISVISGVTLVVMGIIIFTGEFTIFNKYFDLFGTGAVV